MATREHGLFRLLPSPAADAALGGCYIYHSAGPCIDTGVLIDFEGTLTLSIEAVKEMAEVAGFTVNAEALALERENAHLKHENEQLNAANVELNALLNEIATRAHK